MSKFLLIVGFVAFFSPSGFAAGFDTQLLYQAVCHNKIPADYGDDFSKKQLAKIAEQARLFLRDPKAQIEKVAGSGDWINVRYLCGITEDIADLSAVSGCLDENQQLLDAAPAAALCARMYP